MEPTMDPAPEAVLEPPHSDEAEEAAIGAVLINPGSFPRLFAIVKPAAFYNFANRWVWEAMAQLAQRDEPIDVITVANELGSRLADIGGNSQLFRLGESFVSSLNGETYAREVRDKAVRRAMLRACNNIAVEAYRDGGEILDLITAANRELRAASQGIADGRGRPASELGPEQYARAQDRARNKDHLPGILTEIPMLDRALMGGLRPGQFFVVASPPGGGKTSLLTQIAWQAARHHHVRYQTLEMTPDEISVRMLAQMSGLNSQQIGVGFIDDNQWESLAAAVDDFSRLKLDVDNTSPLDVPLLRAIAQQAIADERLDLLVVDYAGLMRSPGDGEYEQYRLLSRELKILATDLDVPVLAAHQLNRQAHEQGTPKYWNLRGSGTWEQDADVVLLIYPHGEPTPEGVPYRLEIAKQRNGPTGEAELIFRPTTTRFDPA